MINSSKKPVLSKKLIIFALDTKQKDADKEIFSELPLEAKFY